MRLSDKIWYTRKSRIESATRLNNNDLISQILINYYSVFIVSISIWDLYDKSVNLSLLIVITSIMILVTSIFITNRNFKTRALELKNCYIKLDEIFRKAVSAEEKRSNEIEIISKEYDNVLLFSENHSTYDYLNVLYLNKNSKQNNDDYPIITKFQIFQLFLYKIFRKVIFLVLFIFPVILVCFLR